MALPKINDVPKYDVIIPSTGKKTKFRPFLVKEEKVLLIAMESEDSNNILTAMMDTLEACVDKIDRNELTTFDIEYLFTRIRTKSVGESADIQLKCKECTHLNPVSVNLDEVGLTDTDTKNTKIDLGNNIILEMQYPSYAEMLKHKQSESKTEQMFDTLRMCMKNLRTEDELISLKEITVKELNEFIESMNSQQFKELTAFVENMPRLRYSSEYICENCGEKNDVLIEGFDNFFM